MEELIPIQEHNGKKAVSARALHAFLESKAQFTDWIKDRIDKYGLIENQDYEVFQNFLKNPSGGRPLTEYALTIEAAKELSMVESNERGKEARLYFIACEKEWKEAAKNLSPAEYLLHQAQLLVAQEKRLAENERRTATIEQKVDALEIRTHTRPEYFTVVGYANSCKVRVDYTQAKKAGKLAAKACREMGYPIDKCSDGKFGYVGMYPAKVLKGVLISMGMLLR